MTQAIVGNVMGMFSPPVVSFSSVAVSKEV